MASVADTALNHYSLALISMLLLWGTVYVISIQLEIAYDDGDLCDMPLYFLHHSNLIPGYRSWLQTSRPWGETWHGALMASEAWEHIWLQFYFKWQVSWTSLSRIEYPGPPDRTGGRMAGEGDHPMVKCMKSTPGRVIFTRLKRCGQAIYSTFMLNIVSGNF